MNILGWSKSGTLLETPMCVQDAVSFISACGCYQTGWSLKETALRLKMVFKSHGLWILIGKDQLISLHYELRFLLLMYRPVRAQCIMSMFSLVKLELENAHTDHGVASSRDQVTIAIRLNHIPNSKKWWRERYLKYWLIIMRIIKLMPLWHLPPLVNFELENAH